MSSKVISVLICLFIFHLLAAGSVAGCKIGVYEIKKGDFSVKITNYGARIISVFLPDKNGKIDDVVLGYDTVKEYINETRYFGALLGRVVNRIGGAQFTLNGTLYKLVPNEGNNTIHGGPKGFSKVVWKVSKYVQDGPSPYITLTYFSADGEEGFPGAVLASVTFALKDPYKLSVVFKAKALNKATPINLSHHPYWNIGGHTSGDILSNVIQIFGSHITLVDKELIPTGEIAPVKNTPYDFLKPHTVGSRINKLQNGYDINYALDSTAKMKPVGVVYDKKSGRMMNVKASAPGVQFYTSNWDKSKKGKGGFMYPPHAALALETLILCIKLIVSDEVSNLADQFGRQVFFCSHAGKIGDVVLGYDTIKEYRNDTSYFGAALGRVANRIGGAQFTLNGTHYKLVANEGVNMLHGGLKGFSKVVWKVRKYVQDGPSPYITLTYHSADGEEGFPGDVVVSVTYALKDHYNLSVVFKAKALNKATPINLSHHPYWNIGGHNSGDVLSQVVQIFASHITPLDTQHIPTGIISPVKNTPYDFLKPRKVGSRIDKIQNGYDINYALDSTEKMKHVAIVYDKKSGREMDIKATAPGVQFYTANWVINTKGKGGYVYQPHSALCLETQGFPDAVNHPNFPSTIVTPGKSYVHSVLYTFTIKKY
ncbi:hypothetical protein KY290_029663 [Solanum tuberosum]|uniref:Aldose 1-epimerase n=1 Tax=Solanum tuberosum TaxID=4113 RepID=A0ABQ7ULE1_SOLTU|nr:hypothetical protein KY290_029663 [Solanum tuberosum]